MFWYNANVNEPPLGLSVNLSHEPLKIQSYCGGLVAQVVSGTSNGSCDAESCDAPPTEFAGANPVGVDGTTPRPAQAASASAVTTAIAPAEMVGKRMGLF
jgi:hypothetical protein